MSNYTAPAIHPGTGVIQDALWLDDYYGPYRYAVRFDDGKVFQADACELPDDPRPEELTQAFKNRTHSLTDCLRRVIDQQ